jgi:tetratricopeptide (TPR) repeat protein
MPRVPIIADQLDRLSAAARSLRTALESGEADAIEAAWRATVPADRTDLALLRDTADAGKRLQRPFLLDEALSAATDLAPDDLWLHVHYIRAAADRGDLAGALPRCDILLTRFPREGLAHVIRGEILADVGRLAAAEASFREAVAIEPNLVWSHIRYAGIAAVRGDKATHLHRLQEGFLALPDDPLIAGELAEALIAAGRREEAGETLAEAVAANPQDRDLRARLDQVSQEAAGPPDQPGASSPEVKAAPAASPFAGVIGVLVSRHPAIIYSAVYAFEPVVTAVMPFYEALSQPVTFLFQSNQSLVFHDRLRAQFPREAAQLQQAHPLARIKFLVNDVHELYVARGVGLDAELISNNAWIDETIFRIMPGEIKQFDAVYNARAHAYKRHDLAVGIESLLLLVAEPEPAQLQHLAELLPRARMNRAHLTAAEIVRNLNTALCGLCLSPAEGAMYASVEYLLCGLPVVTTRSIGGRDWFFSDDYVVYCDADAAAVRRAVETAISRSVNPELIRDSTIARLHRERLAFFDLLERIFTEHGQPQRKAAPEFRSWFEDKANYKMRSLAEFVPN